VYFDVLTNMYLLLQRKDNIRLQFNISLLHFKALFNNSKEAQSDKHKYGIVLHPNNKVQNEKNKKKF